MAPRMQNNPPGEHNGRPHHRDRRHAASDQRRDAPPSGSSAGSHPQASLKSAAYDECYAAIVAIWRDEGGETLDDIALMSTINSVLANRFPHFFWTGFYRVINGRLVVGPYIGTVGCLQIEFGRGVCGTAAARRETVIVPDVNQFPGHIACDPNSKSEIVVPLFRGDDLIAVLDIDATQLNAFDDEDARGLARILGLFTAKGTEGTR